MRGVGLRSRGKFLDWCVSGARPSFIPSNPDQAYRNAGWISYPDWLGYAPRVRKIVVPDRKRVAANCSSERAKAEFVDFVLRARSDIEIKKFPRGFLASYRFRIRDAGAGGNNAPTLWMPIQLRCTKSNNTRGGLFQVRHTADPETGIIILSEHGAIAGLRCEIGSDFRTAEFSDYDKMLPIFDKWWVSCPRLSEEELMQKLRAADCRNLFGSSAMSNLRRAYFDPLRLTVETADNLMCRSLSNVILGGRFRILVRNVTYEARMKSYMYANLANGGHRPIHESDDVDFVITTSFVTGSSYSDSVCPIFLFPKSFLVQSGAIATAEQPGKHTIYLYPPWKKELRKITAVRKAEQAPFFVDSVERFAEILNAYGSNVSTDSEKSEHGEGLHVAKV